MIVEPGCVLIGCGETRTQDQGARQLAALFGEMGWEARVQPFPARYVHLDVVYATLGDKLGAVCPAAAPASLISWLRSKGFDLIEVPDDEAFTLGVNAMPLGSDRVLSSSDATTLNAALRARGVTVLDPACRCSRPAAAEHTAWARRCAVSAAPDAAVAAAEPARCMTPPNSRRRSPRP